MGTVPETLKDVTLKDILADIVKGMNLGSKLPLAHVKQPKLELMIPYSILYANYLNTNAKPFFDVKHDPELYITYNPGVKNG